MNEPPSVVIQSEDTKAMTDKKRARPGMKWVKVKKTRMSMEGGYMQMEDYDSYDEVDDIKDVRATAT